MGPKLSAALKTGMNTMIRVTKVKNFLVNLPHNWHRKQI